jgi:hypothetical protein
MKRISSIVKVVMKPPERVVIGGDEVEKSRERIAPDVRLREPVTSSLDDEPLIIQDLQPGAIRSADELDAEPFVLFKAIVDERAAWFFCLHGSWSFLSSLCSSISGSESHPIGQTRGLCGPALWHFHTVSLLILRDCTLCA